MAQLPELAFAQFIHADGDRLTTDSLKVAAAHGKQHRNLLKLIRQRVAEAGAWGLLHFEHTPNANLQNGEIYDVFTMTQAGYQFLVGKMTGKKAVQHQIAFITAFESMQAFVKNQREGLQYRCIAKELECKDSFRRGSIHGRGLQVRKVEKPVLDAELAALQSLVQPSLLN